MRSFFMWISYHVFYWDTSSIDDLIINIFNEFSKEKIRNFFFIRYWEGGPHIRIRVREEEDITSLQVKHILSICLLQTLKKYPNAKNITLDKIKFYRSTFTDGLKINPDKMEWYQNLQIVSKDYIPEISRYGGMEILPYSEHAFIASSKYVNSILNLHLSKKSKILLLFGIFYSLIDDIFMNDVSNRNLFVTNSLSYWNKFKSLKKFHISIKNNFWEKINNLALQIKKDVFYQYFFKTLFRIYCCKEISTEYRRAILFSQFHMTANRLGLPIEFESLFYKYMLERIQCTNER